MLTVVTSISGMTPTGNFDPWLPFPLARRRCSAGPSNQPSWTGLGWTGGHVYREQRQTEMLSSPLDRGGGDDAVPVGLVDDETAVGFTGVAPVIVEPLASKAPSVKAGLSVGVELALASMPQGPACGSAGLMSFVASATCVQLLHR